MSAPMARRAKQAQGALITSFAAILMLLIEYGFGIWVNLYGTLPDSDKGVGVVTGFDRAVADGPVGLSIHAALGILLLVTALTALLRSILARRAALIAMTTVGLLAVLSAALSGSSFVGDGKNSSSMSMAMATAVAIGAYALVLFFVAARPVPSRS